MSIINDINDVALLAHSTHGGPQRCEECHQFESDLFDANGDNAKLGVLEEWAKHLALD